MEKIAQNLEKITNSINSATSANEVKIIAVSKSHSFDTVNKAIESGVFCFGENKVKECKEKFKEIINEFNLDLHMIGHLQTNKVKDALEIFGTIHTLDRENLALEIKKKLSQNSITKDFFIQINIGEEAQKSGIAIDQSDNFIQWCTNDLKLNIIGLMCIPPFNVKAIPYFEKLKTIAERNHLKKLSMGMSSDYIDAVKCGATHIRIGTGIFGERKK